MWSPTTLPFTRCRKPDREGPSDSEPVQHGARKQGRTRRVHPPCPPFPFPQVRVGCPYAYLVQRPKSSFLAWEPDRGGDPAAPLIVEIFQPGFGNRASKSAVCSKTSERHWEMRLSARIAPLHPAVQERNECSKQRPQTGSRCFPQRIAKSSCAGCEASGSRSGLRFGQTSSGVCLPAT